jgi:hypothetical protein
LAIVAILVVISIVLAYDALRVFAIGVVWAAAAFGQ